MKKTFSAKRIAKIAVVAALYFALTVAIAPLSYGAIQLRFSEILVLLCFFNKDYCYSMVIGCALANLFSPMALLDVPFGTLATLIAVVFIFKSKNILIASLFPTIFNGIIIGGEITFLSPERNLTIFLINMGTVALGEFIVVSVLGVIIFLVVQKNKNIMRLIGINNPRLHTTENI